MVLRAPRNKLVVGPSSGPRGAGAGGSDRSEVQGFLAFPFPGWAQEFGRKRALQCAWRLPPRPLRGRWLSIHSAEKYLLCCGPDETFRVFDIVLAKEATERLANAASAGHDANPSEGDDYKAYSIKIGKWIKESLKSLSDSQFWLIVGLAHKSRWPVDRLSIWVQKKRNLETHPKVVELVRHRAQDVMRQFDRLLGGNGGRVWPEIISLPPDQQHDARCVAVRLCIGVATDFFRRVLGPCNQYPLLMFLLVVSPAGY
eukprot:1763284-Pyramimonas_sp.AAC.1